jgi:hypothetical protein
VAIRERSDAGGRTSWAAPGCGWYQIGSCVTVSAHFPIWLWVFLAGFPKRLAFHSPCRPGIGWPRSLWESLQAAHG